MNKSKLIRIAVLTGLGALPLSVHATNGMNPEGTALPGCLLLKPYLLALFEIISAIFFPERSIPPNMGPILGPPNALFAAMPAA